MMRLYFSFTLLCRSQSLLSQINQWLCIFLLLFMRMQRHLTSGLKIELLPRLLSHPTVVEHMKSEFTCWGCDVTSKYGYTLVCLNVCV